jgi:DNA polymerase-3 subunit chi
MSATRVSFYVLGGADGGSRLGYACRLVEKAYKLQHRIHAHAEDDGMARQLDDLLWTFRQGSFVPHELLVPGSAPPLAPVTIGCAGGPAEPPAADLLVNLASEVPAFYQRFARVAEIVDGSAAGREAGRARHRFYRAQGLEPETHEVT